MLSVFATSLAMSMQPAGALQPLVVNLCNQTPARVAYSVVYPSGPRSSRRRGWLTVEPGACLSGAIGESTGGEALVHAMSGEYRWPEVEAPARSCLPANAHNSIAVEPPCPTGTRETAFEVVEMDALRGRYALSYTVSCADLAEGDRRWCATGRVDEQGFAEAVRTLEVCNLTGGAAVIATAAEHDSGEGYQVQGWTPVEAGQCGDVWRGLNSEGLVYVHAGAAGNFERTLDTAHFCVSMTGDFDAVIERRNEDVCGEGERRTAFRPVEFGPNVSRMSLDLGG